MTAHPFANKYICTFIVSIKYNETSEYTVLYCTITYVYTYLVFTTEINRYILKYNG